MGAFPFQAFPKPFPRFFQDFLREFVFQSDFSDFQERGIERVGFYIGSPIILLIKTFDSYHFRVGRERSVVIPYHARCYHVHSALGRVAGGCNARVVGIHIILRARKASVQGLCEFALFHHFVE